MHRNLMRSAVAAALAVAAVVSVPAFSQMPSVRPAEEPQPGPIPRLANGKPNLQGNWFKVGARPPGQTVGGGAPANFGGARGGGAGARGAGTPDAKEFFSSNRTRIPYTPAGLRERRWINTHETLDGEPRCQLAGTPRAALAPPYPHMIIQDDNQVVILYEYVHEPHIVPLNDSPRKGTRTWMGESRGHWEGDTLVINTEGFNGRSYMAYNEIISENAKVEERFTMTGPNTYDYVATVTDPVIFTEPFVIKYKVGRQRDADQLLSYDCLEGEDDLHHYSPDVGGMGGVKLEPQPAEIYGCLRAEPVGNGEFSYTVVPLGGRPVKLTPVDTLKKELPVLMDREVKFDGKWLSGKTNFSAVYGTVHAAGCRWDGK
jgi:hypothetical protein